MLEGCSLFLRAVFPPDLEEVRPITSRVSIKLQHLHSRSEGSHQEQGPTGTRYPTRTRSFCQYPNPTRFFFKIIGYFGYWVFQKNFNFCINLMCRLFKFWPVSFKATYILGQYNKVHQVGAILHVFMPRDRSSSALHLTTTMFSTF